MHLLVVVDVALAGRQPTTLLAPSAAAALHGPAPVAAAAAAVPPSMYVRLVNVSGYLFRAIATSLIIYLT